MFVNIIFCYLLRTELLLERFLVLLLALKQNGDNLITCLLPWDTDFSDPALH